LGEENQSRQNKNGNQQRNQPPLLLLAQEQEGLFANLAHKALYFAEGENRKPFRQPFRQVSSRESNVNLSGLPILIFLKSGCAGLSR